MITSASLRLLVALAVWGATDLSASSLRVIVPVVGSNTGAHGSHFRTSLQLHNRTAVEMRGELVIRPAWAASEGDNRSLPYVLEPHQTVAYEDVVAAAGIAGLGSMDFFVEQGSVPTIVARAYNDGGEAGTSGVSVRPVSPNDALSAGQRGTLIIPADMERFRFNIGVRALGEGARMTVVINRPDGTIAASLGQMTFAPHSFRQQTGSQFLDGRELSPNHTITFHVLEGAAIIYGSTTDNRTNDPSLQIVRGSEE